MINMKNKRGFAFIPALIVFAMILIFVIIIVKNPAITIFGQTFRLVPLRWGKIIIFWLTFLAFFLVVALTLYIYYFSISKAWTQIHKFIEMLKKASVNIERYFIRLHH